MRFFVLALLALVYLTSFTVSAKGGSSGGSSGGDSGSSSSGSDSGSSSGSSSGGSSGGSHAGGSTDNTTESSATLMYAAPNAQTYLNLQNILMAAGVMALAQHHFTGQ